MLLHMLSDKIILVKGGCPRPYGGCLPGFGRADEGGMADRHILCRHQDKPELSVLAPSAGTLD